MESRSESSAAESAARSRVYIVDGYPLIRRGLVELIGEAPDIAVCGEAEDGSAAFNAIMQIRPDVVIVEIALSGNSGIELIKSIRSFDPKIGILVVSMQDEDIYAPRAMRAGARGFVSKHVEGDRILDAIRRIRSGRLYFSQNVESDILSRIVRGDRHPGESLVANLSDRELEIGRLIGGGATTREIAVRLRVSVKTVETHRSHLKEKLGLKNSARLVQFWVNWVSAEERGRRELSLDIAPNGDTPAVAPNTANTWAADQDFNLRTACRSPLRQGDSDSTTVDADASAGAGGLHSASGAKKNGRANHGQNQLPLL